jgi:hypothetical protein
MKSAFLVVLLHTCTIAAINDLSFDPALYAPKDVLRVDVAILGGGATGTYAAVALSDAGKSIAVIERSGNLGGQTDTYIDPVTGQAFDYGVQRYQLDNVTTSFLNRLGVKFDNSFPAPYNTTTYADFSTQKVWSFTPGTNFTGYIQQLQRFPWTVWTSNIPEPIPADLYTSMGDFIIEHNLQDVAFSVFTEYGAPLLDHPPFSVLSETGLAAFGATLANTLRATGGNSQIYKSAQKVLGSRVLYNSTIASSQRSDSGVCLVVKTGSDTKLIVAKRLLVTVPTVDANTASLNPDDKESDIFSKFFGSGYYAGMVKLEPGVLPAATSFRNAVPGALYNIPTGPAVLFLSPSTIPNLYRYGYFSETVIPTAQAGAAAVASIQKFVNTISNRSSVVEALEVKSHSPFHSRLPADAIKAGYWSKMYALQGHRKTWYTGCQFLPGSSQLWNYTASLLPDIVAGL